MGESTIETLGPLATIASFMVGVENGWFGFYLLQKRPISSSTPDLLFHLLLRERELPDSINNVNNDAW